MIKNIFLHGLVIIAGICICGFSAKAGYKRDKNIEVLLKSPSIVDTWDPKMIVRRTYTANNPLLNEADEFAKLLNPPVVKRNTHRTSSKKVTRKNRSTIPKPKPKNCTPGFKLLATSCYLARDDQSMALIQEPGKGIRWVRKDQCLGYIRIKSVKSGYIIYDNGIKQDRMYVDPKYKNKKLAFVVKSKEL